MDPPEMLLQVSPARRGASTSSSSSSVGAVRAPGAVEISLRAQTADKKEKAAISIRVSDPDVMVDRILSVLAAKFPINAFYKVIANQEKYVREAVSQGVPPGSVDRRVQEAMYLDLLQLSNQQEDANSPASVTNRSATALIKEALSTLTAEELVEVTTNVSPSNSGKLAKALLHRVRTHADQSAQKTTTCLTGEEVVAAAVETEPSELSSGKWESVNESLLLADRETEHSNGAESVSSHFSNPSQVSDWKELAYRTWDSAIVDEAMNMSASELARVVEGDSLVNQPVCTLAQTNTRFREWIEELLTVKRKSTKTVVRTSVHLESQPAVGGIRLIKEEKGSLRPAPTAFEGVSGSQTLESTSRKTSQTISTYSQSNVVVENTQVPLGVPLSEMAPGLVNPVEETPSAIQAPDVPQFDRRSSSHSRSSHRKTSESRQLSESHSVNQPSTIMPPTIDAPMVMEVRGDVISASEGMTTTRTDVTTTQAETTTSTTMATGTAVTTATTTTTETNATAKQPIPSLVMSESPARQSSAQTFDFSDVSSTMCRITEVNREGSPAKDMTNRATAKPIEMKEGDARLAWLTKIEMALEHEYRYIVEIARGRVSGLLQQLRVPGQNLSAYSNEEGIQFVRQNQALAKRIVLGLKYAVFSRIREVCEQTGFEVSLPDIPATPLVPMEEIDQHMPISQLLVEAAVRVAIFGCATYLTNVTSVRECSPQLQAVMTIPTDVPERQRPQWLVDHVNSRRREMLSNALNASIDSYQWEVLNGRGMLAFVESFFTRRAYAPASEMIREVSGEPENVVPPPSVVRRAYEAQQHRAMVSDHQSMSPTTPEAAHHAPKQALQMAVSQHQVLQQGSVQQQQSAVQQSSAQQQQRTTMQHQSSIQRTSVQSSSVQSSSIQQGSVMQSSTQHMTTQRQSSLQQPMPTMTHQQVLAYQPQLQQSTSQQTTTVQHKALPTRSSSSLAAYNVVSSRVISSSTMPTSPAVRTVVPPKSPTTTYTKTYTTTTMSPQMTYTR